MGAVSCAVPHGVLVDNTGFVATVSAASSPACISFADMDAVLQHPPTRAAPQTPRAPPQPFGAGLGLVRRHTTARDFLDLTPVRTTQELRDSRLELELQGESAPSFSHDAESSPAQPAQAPALRAHRPLLAELFGAYAGRSKDAGITEPQFQTFAQVRPAMALPQPPPPYQTPLDNPEAAPLASRERSASSGGGQVYQLSPQRVSATALCLAFRSAVASAGLADAR